MNQLSTGHDSTLKSYRELSVAIFGKDSGAVQYIDDLIAKSPDGENEEVLADEGQMIYLLTTLTLEDTP
jgi:hypothetical protein